MKEQMEQQGRPQPRSEREQLNGEIERDPVDVNAEQLLKTDVAVVRQRERRDEVLTELPIRDPRLALRHPLERKRVDEHGATVPELDVECGGVPQRHPELQSSSLNGEGSQGGVLELAEAPLIRIRDERDRLRAEDSMSPRTCCKGDVDLFVRDEEPIGDERAVQPRCHQQVVVLGVTAIHLSVKDVVAREEETAGISERAGKDLHGSRSEGESSREEEAVRRMRTPQIRRQNSLTATMAARKAPMSSWKR